MGVITPNFFVQIKIKNEKKKQKIKKSKKSEIRKIQNHDDKSNNYVYNYHYNLIIGIFSNIYN